MGQVAVAFVNFLARVHDASKQGGSGEKAKAEEAVSEAAKKLMALYVAYKPAEPKEDAHDASAVTLIENVDDMETFAAYVTTKG
jgi:hypothetical protein